MKLVTTQCLFVSRVGFCHCLINVSIFAVFPIVVNLLCELPCRCILQRPGLLVKDLKRLPIRFIEQYFYSVRNGYRYLLGIKWRIAIFGNQSIWVFLAYLALNNNLLPALQVFWFLKKKMIVGFVRKLNQSKARRLSHMIIWCPSSTKTFLKSLCAIPPPGRCFANIKY